MKGPGLAQCLEEEQDSKGRLGLEKETRNPNQDCNVRPELT